MAHGAGHLEPEEIASGLVVVGQYQFLVERAGTSLVVGNKGVITLRVFDTKLQQVVSGKRVRAALKLPQLGAFREPDAGAVSRAMDPASVGMDSPVEWDENGTPDTSDLMTASDLLEPGHYRIVVKPQIAGAHLLKIAFYAGDGNTAPLLIEIPVQVGVARHPWRGWLASLLALAGVFGGTFFWMKSRERYEIPGKPFDLMVVPTVRRFLLSRAYPSVLQWAAMLVFGIVIASGLFDTATGDHNFATILTWTVWWAGVIFTFLLVGRVWCAMCPVGAISDWAGGLAKPRRAFPKPLRNIWIATGLLVLLTWADAVFGIVNNPKVTAWLLIGMAAAAGVTALLYQRRAFCRYLCPIGGMIGLYSMVSPLEWRAKSQAACRSHFPKTCYSGNENTKGCSMFEYPAAMERNNYCHFCADCAKACPADNFSLRFRPFAADLRNLSRPRLDEAYLAVALTGISLLAVGHMIAPWQGWMIWIAQGLGAMTFGIRGDEALAAVGYTVLLVGFALVGLPLIMGGIARFAISAQGKAREAIHARRALFLGLCYALIPVGLSLHLAHNIHHLISEGGLIIPATQKLINLYTPWNLGGVDWKSFAVGHSGFITLLQLGILFWLAPLAVILLLKGMRGSRDNGRRGAASVIAFMMVFALLGANAVFLQMDMMKRHGAAASAVGNSSNSILASKADNTGGIEP